MDEVERRGSKRNKLQLVTGMDVNTLNEQILLENLKIIIETIKSMLGEEGNKLKSWQNIESFLRQKVKGFMNKQNVENKLADITVMFFDYIQKIRYTKKFSNVYSFTEFLFFNSLEQKVNFNKLYSFMKSTINEDIILQSSENDQIIKEGQQLEDISLNKQKQNNKIKLIDVKYDESNTIISQQSPKNKNNNQNKRKQVKKTNNFKENLYASKLETMESINQNSEIKRKQQRKKNIIQNSCSEISKQEECQISMSQKQQIKDDFKQSNYKNDYLSDQDDFKESDYFMQQKQNRNKRNDKIIEKKKQLIQLIEQKSKTRHDVKIHEQITEQQNNPFQTGQQKRVELYLNTFLDHLMQYGLNIQTSKFNNEKEYFQKLNQQQNQEQKYLEIKLNKKVHTYDLK